MFQRTARQITNSSFIAKPQKTTAFNTMAHKGTKMPSSTVSAILMDKKPVNALMLHEKASAAAVGRKQQQMTQHDPKQTVAYSEDMLHDTTPNQLIKDGYRHIFQGATNPTALFKKSQDKDGNNLYTITVGDTFDIHDAVSVGLSSWYGVHHESEDSKSALGHMVLKDAKEYYQAIQMAKHEEFGYRKIIFMYDLTPIAAKAGHVVIAHGHALANTEVTVKSTGASKYVGKGGGYQLFTGTGTGERNEFLNTKERAELGQTILESARKVFIPSIKSLIGLTHIGGGKYQISSIRSICPDRDLDQLNGSNSFTVTEKQLAADIHGKENSTVIELPADSSTLRLTK